MSNREHDRAGGDLCPVSQHDPAGLSVADDQVVDAGLEADLAAERDDLLTQISHDVDENIRADVGLGQVADFRGRARFDQLGEDFGAAVGFVFNLRGELAVGKCPRAPLAKQGVGFGVERASLPEGSDVLRPRLGVFSAFEQQGRQARFRQNQACE